MKASNLVQIGKKPRRDLKSIEDHSINSKDAELALFIIFQLSTSFC